MWRRAQPWLGTLVEVRTQANLPRAEFDRAADAAFAAVAQVHRLMSFHDPASDLRRLARARAGERVRVARATARVLRQAQAWARRSGGAFDAGCGARAVAAGWLPAPAATEADAGPPPPPVAFEQALELVADDLVRVHAPVWLDFGGIAKGHAVDRAVAALRRAGLREGAVNAGGDLRVFGPEPEPLLLRSPFDDGAFMPLPTLRDSACATSASGQVAVRADATCTTHARQARPDAPRSVTVCAPTACAADALTKIVWLQGHAARPLLRAARARAWWFDAQGTLHAC